MKRRIWCTGSFALLVMLAGCSSEGGDGAVKSPNASTGSEAGAGSAAAAGSAASAAPVAGPLPAAFKGYELYAWEEGSEFAFTLITGTNREKTVAEIMPRSPDMAEGEFIAVRGQGLAALQDVLGRVPAGTSVILAHVVGLPPLSAAHRAVIVSLL